jgi:hypothetical protein
MRFRRILIVTASLGAPLIPAQRALAIGCTPQQFQQCANLPLADTCFKWGCLPGPPVAQGGRGFNCVLSDAAPAGTPCHSDVACVSSGTCGPTGTCNANPGARTTCSTTSTGARDEVLCWCANFTCNGIIPPHTFVFGANASPTARNSPGVPATEDEERLSVTNRGQVWRRQALRTSLSSS